VNYKRKSRCRFFLLMQSRTPPISSEFRGGGGLNPPNHPFGTPLIGGKNLWWHSLAHYSYQVLRKSRQKYTLQDSYLAKQGTTPKKKSLEIKRATNSNRCFRNITTSSHLNRLSWMLGIIYMGLNLKRNQHSMLSLLLQVLRGIWDPEGFESM